MVLLLALTLLVFGQPLFSALTGQNDAVCGLPRLISLVGRLLSFLLFTGVFAAMYRFLSGCGRGFCRHLPGAAFASAGWLLYSALLSLYLRAFNPEQYSLFGSMGALLLFLFWVRFCMSVFLFGAEINVLVMRRVFIAGKHPAGHNGDAGKPGKPGKP